jgi:RNA polymerase sigma-70 factor (ECF subfamily)
MEESIPRLIARLKAGDPEAAAEVVRRYGPVIRTMVRIRHFNKGLQSLHDSEDVCQSILADLQMWNAAGLLQDKLKALREEEADLLRFLVRMARNKKADYVRKHNTLKRAADHGPRASEDALNHIPFPGAAPESLIEWRDSLARLRPRFRDEEWQVGEWLAEGKTWEWMAEQLGESVSAPRMRWERACARVRAELRAKGGDDGSA